MISAQYRESSRDPGHPQHGALRRPPPERQMKKTALDASHVTVVHSCDREDDGEKERERNKKIIHTDAVEQTINQQPPNPIIQQPAPKINKREEQLPRATRRTLAQLRSGKCPLLKAYLCNIGAADHPNCPLCNHDLHSTQHLFECREVPTRLTPIDLWYRPTEVAELAGRWRTLLDEAEAAEEAQGAAVRQFPG